MKEVVLKNSDVYALNSVITIILKQDEDARQQPGYKALPSKFSWALLRTKKLIADVIETIEEFRAPSPEFQAYTADRIKLCTELAEKDEAGNPVVVNNEFKLSEQNTQVFKERLEQLQQTHKAALDIENNKLKQLHERLEETTTVKLFVVGIEHVPDLPSSYMEILDSMIE